MLTIYGLLMLVCMVTAQTTNPYCAISTDHTMCKYVPKGCPLGLIVNTVSAADQTACLKTHNDLRRKVANGQQTGQPSASNMRELKWNSELATIAQRWADQCTFGHDANRNTASYWWVGQNAALVSSSADNNRVANFSQAITLWFNEVTNPGFNPNNIDPYVFNSGTGHYTQVSWGDTDRIGCAYAYYKEGSWYRKLYICNYGLGGNIQGTAMYKKGTAASACLNGAKSTTYPGLCAS
ncbi:hypothetical protein CHUAL_004611 [Chamberlinius hualienensis]